MLCGYPACRFFFPPAVDGGLADRVCQSIQARSSFFLLLHPHLLSFVCIPEHCKRMNNWCVLVLGRTISWHFMLP